MTVDWRSAVVVGGVLGVVVWLGSSPKEEPVVLDGSDRAGRHFSWLELTRSNTANKLGVDNTPSPAHRANLRRLVEQLDRIRDAHGAPVRITSGYRSPALNDAVGGMPDSQHTTGEAVDIKADGLSSAELARLIVRLGIPFDQLIWYPPDNGGQVHISLSATGHQRQQTLWSPAKKVYQAWVA